MSDSAPSTAQTIRPALFLLVPLFTVALVVLALSNRPQAQGPRPYTEAKKQVRIAYALIGALAALATLAGALPLSHAANAQAEALIQTLLALLLGLPVLHLPASYVRPRHGAQLITRIVHTGLLVIFLSSATLLALLAPFLPPSDSAVPLYLPPALFLAYTLIAVPRVALALFSFSSSSLSPSSRPITIHVATHRTSIPLSLPSPASTASSFPFEHDDHDEDDIVHRPRRHRHEKIASVDSSTSTITAVDLPRRSLASPIPPPLVVPHNHLPSSDVEHQHARLIPRDRDIDVNATTYSYPVQNHNAHLRAQLIYNRSRSLLVFLLAVQLTALAAYACALASHIPASSRAAADALGIAHAACTVLAVTGTMSAYLLHAYNTHLAAKPSSSSPSSPSSHPHHVSEDPTTTSIPRSSASPNNSGAAIQMLEVQVDRNARHRPVLIQLAPAAGQRERKRADAARMNLPKLSPVRKEDFEHVGQDDKRGFGYDLGGYEVEDACATTPVFASSTVPGLGLGMGMQLNRPAPPLSLAVPSSPGVSPLEDAVVSPTTTHREPIVLTYERPLGERSLLETTDTEGGGTRSLFSSLSLGSMKSGSASLRRAVSSASASASAGSSAGPAVAGPSSGPLHALQVQSQARVKRASTTNTKNPNTGRTKSRKRRHVEDPAAYIRKRGSLPAPASSSESKKKLFGWELAWDPLPLSIPSNGKNGKSGRSVQEQMESVDESFIDLDLDGMWGNGQGFGNKERGRERERETRKLKRNTMGDLGVRIPYTMGAPPMPVPAVSVSVPFPSFGEVVEGRGGGAEGVGAGGVGVGVGGRGGGGGGGGMGRGPSRKLKKRAPGPGPGSRPGTADTTTSNGWSHKSSHSGSSNLNGAMHTSAPLPMQLLQPQPQPPHAHAHQPPHAHGPAPPPLFSAPPFSAPPLSAPPAPALTEKSFVNLGDKDTAPRSPCAVIAPCIVGFAQRRSLKQVHRRVTSGASTATTATTATSATADSGVSGMSRGSGFDARARGTEFEGRARVRGDGKDGPKTSEGGLRLKRSFKLGVGRTLGPGLTLAAAAASVVRLVPDREKDKDKDKERGRGRGKEKGVKRVEVLVTTEGARVVSGGEVGEEKEETWVDVDVDGDGNGEEVEKDLEMSSIVAAKLVSASIARATPAATIVAPSSSGPHLPSSQQGKALPTLATANSNANANANPAGPSSPISPASAKSGWKPHPFAESRESFGVYAEEGEGLDESSGLPHAQGEGGEGDEVLQLEREMFDLGPGTPTMATPTLAMLRLQPEPSEGEGQTQGQGQSQMPTPDPTPEKTISKSKSKSSLKKRESGSNSSLSLKHRSEWMPVSSCSMPSSVSVATSSSGSGSGSGSHSTTTTTKHEQSQGFPYKFPTFFQPSSKSSSSASPPPPPTPTLSFLSQAFSQAQSQSQISQQTKAPSRSGGSAPSTPRASTLRLSAMTMGSVRTTFAGLGARMSGATARMSVNSGAGGSTKSGSAYYAAGSSMGGGHAFGQMITEDDDDGDFMDLRDPFASPPPSKMGRAGKGKHDLLIVDDGIEDVFGAYGTNATMGGGGGGGGGGMGSGVVAGVGKKMSAWGRLPMPVRSLSSPPSGGGGGSGSISSAKRASNQSSVRTSKSHVERPGKRRKEKRTRKTTLPGLGGTTKSPAAAAANASSLSVPVQKAYSEEDVDFDIEEALLAQRLLRRLDSAEFEWEGS